MSLVWPILILIACAAVAIGAMLLVRRQAPEGSYFSDGDRASGVFGVIATGFSVLLGFVIFLAFTSYDETKQGSEVGSARARAAVRDGAVHAQSVRDALWNSIVCYARYAVHQEWPRLKAGTQGNRFNPWGVELFRTLEDTSPNGPTEEAAFSKWLDQTSEREAARQDRLHAAEGVVPTPLWLVLFLAAAYRGLHALLADSAERAKTQALLRLRRLGRRRHDAAALVPRQPVLRRSR